MNRSRYSAARKRQKMRDVAEGKVNGARINIPAWMEDDRARRRGERRSNTRRRRESRTNERERWKGIVVRGDALGSILFAGGLRSRGPFSND